MENLVQMSLALAIVRSRSISGASAWMSQVLTIHPMLSKVSFLNMQWFISSGP